MLAVPVLLQAAVGVMLVPVISTNMSQGSLQHLHLYTSNSPQVIDLTPLDAATVAESPSPAAPAATAMGATS